jgi:PAS domain S-box-containing protein
MDNLHPLLKSQLERYQNTPDQKPAWWDEFVATINASYTQFEREEKQKEFRESQKAGELMETNQQLWRTLDTANSRFKEMENMKTAMLNLLEDERSLEESLREERDRIKAIIASVGEGLIVVDRYFQIMIMNPVAQKELGVTASEVIGRDVREIITSFRGSQPLPEAERPINIAITTGQNVDIGLGGNLLFQSVSGKRFPVSLVVTPLRNESGKEIIGLVIVFRNITAEKKFDEAKSSFISIASHQLRTPLTPLRWFSEMLLKGEMGPETSWFAI